jgi:hypothetical protein
MATTKLADVIVPEVLASMASAEISNYLDFEKTGLASRDYNNVNIKDGGLFAEVPFYNQINGDTEVDEILTDDTSLTPGKITTGKDIGVVCHRGKAWGTRDLAAIISGDDPQKELAKQVGQYWARRLRTSCISVLNGVFAATSGPIGKDATNPHLLDVGVTTGTKVLLTSTNALQTMNLIGDAMNDFDVVIMHSKVYTDVVNAQLVTYNHTFDPKSYDPRDPGKYLGKQIIVTDNVPVDVGTPAFPKYTTYFAKKGCMYLGRQKDLMTETDRDILALEDVLATTIHFVPHVKFIKWNTTDTNPTNTLLATGTQWLSVANDHKFIGLCALVSN